MEPTAEVIARTGRGTGADLDLPQQPAPWDRLTAALTEGGATTWLSVRSSYGVHTRPVFAAWTGASFVTASNPGAVKAGLLDADGRCSLAIELASCRAHLAVQAVARRLAEPADLERAVAAFEAVYGWSTRVEGELLDADIAAPTSGGPPFHVYELAPTRIHAFPTADDFAPTRFVLA